MSGIKKLCIIQIDQFFFQKRKRTYPFSILFENVRFNKGKVIGGKASQFRIKHSILTLSTTITKEISGLKFA